MDFLGNLGFGLLDRLVLTKAGLGAFFCEHFGIARLTKGLFWETLAGRSGLERVKAGDEARY